ncbi:myc target protein 1 homolog [Trichomycterus rosablanca]|uniref:myc target protein 1 homolog n=1 Tax=Trichomycterus rosablanca TaxID=2290929 RepID=UPI002F355E0C
MRLAFLFICTMSANKNNGILENTFDVDEVILAFCLSMLVGLLIGILIFIFMTWISRRRASVRISTHSDQSSSAVESHSQQVLDKGDGFNLSSESTDRATLKVKRQTSLDPNELLGHSFSFQVSTFRPLRKKGRDEAEDKKQRTLLDSTLTDPYTLGQSESFWLGKGSLRGFLPKQNPPPAYNSVIHIFQEAHN